MEFIALTTDQSARIEALPDDCTIVGVKDGRPLVRQVGGELPRAALIAISRSCSLTGGQIRCSGHAIAAAGAPAR